MATKYFSGEIELNARGVHGMANAEFAKRFPGVKGRRFDGYAMMVGNPVDFRPVWDAAAGAYTNDLRPVDRVINYSNRPSRHECDARCMNASGRTMNCECSCGGKNHGRGAFACEEAA